MKLFPVTTLAAFGASVALLFGLDPCNGHAHPEVYVESTVVDRKVIFAVDDIHVAMRLGKPLTVLCGIVNQAVDTVTVHRIDAWTTSTRQSEMVFENFTSASMHDQKMEANNEFTFEYVVRSEEEREDVHARLLLSVVYSDSRGMLYTDTFFNKTVVYVHSGETVGAGTVFIYVGLALATALVAAFIVFACMEVSPAKSMAKSDTGNSNKPSGGNTSNVKAHGRRRKSNK